MCLVLTCFLFLFGYLSSICLLSFELALKGWPELFNNSYNFICLIGIFILGMFVNIFIILTNLFLTPSFNGIGDTINGIFTAIAMFILNKSVPYYSIIILIFSLVTCLIYSEIIVLKCFSFEEFTKKEIDKRAIKETQGMQSLCGVEIPESKNID